MMNNFTSFQNKILKKQNSRWLTQLGKNCRHWLGLSIGLAIISGILLVLQSSLLANIISLVAMQGYTLHAVKSLMITFFMTIVVRATLAWLREIINCKTAFKVKSQVRQILMSHLCELGPIRSKTLRSGAVTTTVIEQVEALHNFFAYYLPQMSLAVFLPLAILAFIFPINCLAGLILLITAPLIPLFMALVGMGAESVQQKYFQSLSRLGAHFLDVLQGLTTLKLLGESHIQSKKIFQAADGYRKQTMQVLRIAFLSSAMLELFSSAAIALLAVYLGLALLGQIPARGLSLHQALFILLLAPEFYLPLRQLATHYHAKTEALAAASEIQQLLNIQGEPKKTFSIIKFKPETIALNIENLNFSYIKDQPILQNINLTIAAGERLAIVGESGAGKSTLLYLCMNLLTPSSGNIFINDVNLSDINPAVWLKQVSWIGQNTRLFPGTLRENLSLAKPQATVNEMQQALRYADAEEFLQQLPRGLETVIGDNNVGLSGGQIQRISLARAYLKNAPLLLLDEPTASLDSSGEKKIVTALQELSCGKTVILISHRHHTLALTNRVYPL